MFNFDWDAKEDTSVDINPLYTNRPDPKLLFGKGYRGGVDIDEQKRAYDFKIGAKKSEFPESFKEDNSYLTKPSDQMTDRDWRIFREDNDIMIKGGRVPHPIRSWYEI